MEFDDITRTESELPAASSPEPEPPAPKPSALPWILLFVTVAVFVGTTMYLWYRTTEETRRANTAYVEKTKAEVRASQAEQALEGQKATNLQQTADLKVLSDRNLELQGKLDALQASRAAAEKAPPAKASKIKKPVAKKAVKKKKR